MAAMNISARQSAAISGRLDSRPARSTLSRSVRTAKLLKTWLTTIPAWVMVSASR